MAETLLDIRNLSCYRDKNETIISSVSLTIREGDIVILQGKSGCGKTTLLKCLAHLNVYGGEMLYRGRTPKSYGIPSYRTRVLYVPQRPSLLPGTPRDFLHTISAFGSRKYRTTDTQNPVNVAKVWGIDELIWDRNWSNLSGGESQRVALAVAVGLDDAEILLLDEPTSALDPESSTMVENYLASEIRSQESALKAIVWITHSEEQSRRVGTRFIRIADGVCEEEQVAHV